MQFNTLSLLDASHLVTFLGGAAMGSAGQYFADRFTDQRRAQQAASESKKRFAKLNKIMGALLKEMTEDLRNDQSAAIREFVILANERITFNHSMPRFTYYESRHPDILNQVALLVSAGYVYDVTVGTTPIFRISEELVDALIN